MRQISSHLIRLFHSLAAVVLCVSLSAADSGPWVLRDEYPLDKGAYKGVARVSSNAKTIQSGDPFVIAVAFHSTALEAYDVLDPHMVSRGATVAVLAIYDAKGSYIGDLLTPVPGLSPTTEIGFSEWCRIQPREVVVRKVYCTAGVVGGTKYVLGTTLPAGEYRIQAIYLDRFASSCPWHEPANPCGEQNGLRDDNGLIQLPPEDVRKTLRDDPERISRALKEWRAKYNGSELFRSNVLRVELLPRPLEAPKPG